VQVKQKTTFSGGFLFWILLSAGMQCAE